MTRAQESDYFFFAFLAGAFFDAGLAHFLDEQQDMVFLLSQVEV